MIVGVWIACALLIVAVAIILYGCWRDRERVPTINRQDLHVAHEWMLPTDREFDVLIDGEHYHVVPPVRPYDWAADDA